MVGWGGGDGVLGCEDVGDDGGEGVGGGGAGGGVQEGFGDGGWGGGGGEGGGGKGGDQVCCVCGGGVEVMGWRNMDWRVGGGSWGLRLVVVSICWN